MDLVLHEYFRPSAVKARSSAAIPDSKVHGANMGPIWGRQDPGGPHVGPRNFAIWVWFWSCGKDIGLVLPGFFRFQHQKGYDQSSRIALDMCSRIFTNVEIVNGVFQLWRWNLYHHVDVKACSEGDSTGIYPWFCHTIWYMSLRCGKSLSITTQRSQIKMIKVFPHIQGLLPNEYS